MDTPRVQASCRGVVAALAVLASSAGCGVPCRSQSDCPFGSYCVLEVGDGAPEGQCQEDCFVAEDCAQPTSRAHRAVCTNEGQCRVEAYPPRLFILEPEDDTVYEPNTRSVRVSGEVETAAASVSISVLATNDSGCSAQVARGVGVTNQNPGMTSRIPFVVDGVVVDPGRTRLQIVADVEGAKKTRTVTFSVSCPGCPVVSLSRPAAREVVQGLELPILEGTIEPRVPAALWRIHSVDGDVFDGPLRMVGGRFSLARVPIFPGRSRVEVVASSSGAALAEGRCSQTIASSVALEEGLRVVLTWDDSESDLDLNIVGPGGLFGDRASTLGPRSPSPVFGGTIRDDFDGLGPETATIESISDGVFGVVVQATYDGLGPGSNAVVRLVFDGRSLVTGPVGPMYVSAKRGDLWVVGIVRVEAGSRDFVPIHTVLSRGLAPSVAPELWLDSLL